MNQSIPHIHSQLPTQRYTFTDLSECDGLSNHRVDLTHLNIYTIDPPLSTDADDGFSIEYELGTDIFYLYVHIADPTTYFTPTSPIFNDVLYNCVTQYPSMMEPCHMFSKDIVNKCTLMNGIKTAISVVFKFDKDVCIGRRLMFSRIYCAPKYRFTYSESTKYMESDRTIREALRFSKVLAKERNNRYKGLGETIYSEPHYDSENDNFILTKATSDEAIMKKMIADLAIASNTYVANFINDANPNYVFTRNCEDNGIVNTSSPREIMAEIIRNGIRASYDAEKISHKIVGSNLYSHFTSPLRRVSDVIVHFILKDLTLGRDSFSKSQLDTFAKMTTKKTREIKSLQLLDKKYRYYQCMQHLISYDNYVKLKYRFMKYSGMFVNIMIEKINEHNVQISYCLKVKPINYKGINFKENTTHDVIITEIYLPTSKYDSGVLPQLESLFIRS